MNTYKRIFCVSVFVPVVLFGWTPSVWADDDVFSIPLTANAWNLISIPVDVSDESVAGTLGTATSSVDTIYTYDSGDRYIE